MIALAGAKGLLTTPYVFSADDAAAMARAGADIIVCHFGLTAGGAIGARTALKLDDVPAMLDAWAAAARGSQSGPDRVESSACVPLSFTAEAAPPPAQAPGPHRP